MVIDASDYYLGYVDYPDRMKCRFCHFFKDDLQIINTEEGPKEYDGYCKHPKAHNLLVDRGDVCDYFMVKKMRVMKKRNQHDNLGVNVEKEKS